ncbi:MAG: proteasome lid subunit RPN8/RPN11 [Planctomycetota bacterium]
MIAGQHVYCSPSLNSQLRAAAERCVPRECCGLLVGEWEAGSPRIRYWVEVHNLAVDADSFQMDPFAYRDIERKSDREGWQILGIFHSHPRGFGKPSGRDEAVVKRQWGGQSDWIYLICGLKEQDGHGVRGWAWSNNGFCELDLGI